MEINELLPETGDICTSWNAVRIVFRHAGKRDAPQAIRTELTKLAPPLCLDRRPLGRLDLQWNEVQNKPKHIRALSEVLVRLYASMVPR